MRTACRLLMKIKTLDRFISKVYRCNMLKINSTILYNTKELSDKLKLTQENVREYFRKGRFKGVKIGNYWYLTLKNLNRFLNAEKQK